MMVLAVVLLGLAVAVVAFVVDAGFFLRGRRDSQNTADAAALAGAQHLPGNPIEAEDAALEWAALNGWPNGADGVTVTVVTPYKGDPYKIEVTVEGGARGVGFFDALMDVKSRAVAEIITTTTETPDPEANVMVPVPTAGCGGDDATVDGRVADDEGYESIAQIAGENDINFGEAFFACDLDYYYFAFRLNGPSTGGAVANENVYGPNKYHELYQTGWEDAHTFGKLKGSDRSRFQVACGDTPVHDFVQDYLDENDKSAVARGDPWVSYADGDGGVLVAGPASSASSLEYNLEHPEDTGWGDDPGEDPLEQSPPFSPTYPYYDSEYDGWVWEMIYEFSIPRSAYDSCDSAVFFGNPPVKGGTGPVGGMHSSPAKVDEGVFVGVIIREIRLVE